MVASGLPTVYERHAQEMSLLALELQEFVENHVVQHLPDKKLQLRIGLHTGQIIHSCLQSLQCNYSAGMATMSLVTLNFSIIKIRYSMSGKGTL